MAGIYLHIPFCSTKCHYCNFFSTVSLKHKDEVLKALKKEIVIMKNYLGDETINTIYWGGGTPSMLDFNELKSIVNILEDNFNISSDAEKTMEANPDDLHQKKLEEIFSLAFNRLSIGTQSFDDDILKKLNRRHTAEAAVKSVQFAKEVGFKDISIDLIYGIPGLSNEQWKANILKAISMEINHISAYNLTVESGTALDILINKHKYPKLDETQSLEHFEILLYELQKADFEHYEISNFAKNQRYSLHNSNYWKQEKYLGFGPSAHSYNLTSRQWNIANINKYIDGINSDLPAVENEVLTTENRHNEYIMLSLRTIWGMNIEKLQRDFGRKNSDIFKAKAVKFLSEGKMKIVNNCYILSKEGKKFADGIASEFFI
ncbi:MAG: hypothetical protein AUJ98_00180 [Bacteroidetes bacterium CG2_30_33_31]|nr:MAG: hypothetical protein AUJ98_00180 [Bacteroidetes bacterium CG2_30_33_31]